MIKYPRKSELDGKLSYCPDTGIFTWLERLGGSKGDNIFNSLFAGKTAGFISFCKKSKTSYIHIKIGNKTYKAHRLAFAIMGKCLPEEVDHIDHDGCNNRWNNLRPSDSSDNSRNLPMQSSNKSGCIGVNWHKAAKKWQARAVSKDGKRIDLGRFDTLEQAIAVRRHYEVEFGYFQNRPESNV